MNRNQAALMLLGLGCLLGFGLVAASNEKASAAVVQPTPVATAGCWTSHEIKWLPGQPGYKGLRGVGGTSASDVWVVGVANVNDKTHPISAHWDGQSWNPVEMPATGSQYGVLYAATAVATDDVWAVGTQGNSIYENLPLIMRWNGTAWAQVPPPPVESTDVLLAAVAAVSRNDAWVVGRANVGNGRYVPLIMQWNGTSWALVSIAGFESGITWGELYGVSAVSASDVWAVGWGGDGGWLTLHWDGATWRQVPVELQGTGGILEGVTALSANDVWAVGGYLSGNSSQTLILHWDGYRWQALPSPNPDREENRLRYIAAIAPDDIWAAGYLGRREDVVFLAHWDGQSWAEASFPYDLLRYNIGSVVYGAFAVGGDLWLVGDNGGGELLVRHSNNPCQVTATPTPKPSPTARIPLDPPLPVPGNGSLFFRETGKTVSGLFLQYWQQHGGLLQNGYPLSEPMGERSDLDGRVYTVQYFERAEFEYHPEFKGTAYEVLLSQLGRFRYREKYSQPWQKPQEGSLPYTNKRYFPQTGKTVGGDFLDYWQGHGGVAQLGLPISDLIIEKSDLDNKTYTVQYFERAELEYHPENAPPYQVLQAQLGRFRYEQLWGSK